MLTQVILVGSPSKTFDLENVDPNETIILKSLSGLTPGDISLFTGQFARDGGYYRGRRVNTRNPVFTFKLNPDYANDIEVSDIREQLYSWFLGSDETTNPLRVILVDDRKPDREMTVFTEKLETDLFSKTTEVMISTLCVDPYFKSTVATSVAFDSETLVTESEIEYEGTAPAGINISLQIVQPCNGFSITVAGRASFITRTTPFQIGDLVEYNSVAGFRSLKVNGADSINLLVGEYVWPELKPGPNSLFIASDQGPVVSLLSYVYTPLWWGV